MFKDSGPCAWERWLVLLDQVGPGSGREPHGASLPGEPGHLPAGGGLGPAPHACSALSPSLLSPQTSWSSAEASACWPRTPPGCCCCCSPCLSCRPWISSPCDLSRELPPRGQLTPPPIPYIPGRNGDPTLLRSPVLHAIIYPRPCPQRPRPPHTAGLSPLLQSCCCFCGLFGVPSFSWGFCEKGSQVGARWRARTGEGLWGGGVPVRGSSLPRGPEPGRGVCWGAELPQQPRPDARRVRGAPSPQPAGGLFPPRPVEAQTLPSSSADGVRGGEGRAPLPLPLPLPLPS